MVKHAALLLLILSGIVPSVRADIIVVTGTKTSTNTVDTIKGSVDTVKVTSGGTWTNLTVNASASINNLLTVEGGSVTLKRIKNFIGQINISGGALGQHNKSSLIIFEKSLTVSGGNATLNGGTFEEAVTISGGTATIRNSSTFNKSLTVSGGNATLNGGTFLGAITNSGGKVTINNSSAFKSLNVSGVGEADLYGGTFGEAVTISGGKVTIKNPSTFYKSLTVSGGSAFLTGGTFKDTITISGNGSASLNGGTFEKSLNVSGGYATLNGGNFKDTVTISGGTATLNNWSTFDKSLTVSGGYATLNSGNFNDTVTISGGTNTLNGGNYSKSLTVSGGTATLNGGNYNTLNVSENGSATLNGGNYTNSLTVSGNGSAFLHGGNFNQSLTVSGGLLEANGEVSINSGIYASGGEIILVDLDRLAGEISLYEDSVLRMYDTVDNFTISLLEVGGTAYLDGEYTFSDGTIFSACESGYYKILSTSGSIFGANNSSINYTTSGNGAIYVGQIPEPAAVCFICVAGLGFLIARRLFARFAESAEGELATSTWPLTGDQLRIYVSEDFSGEENSEWSRVEWNRRECGWMLRITNQIPMPRLQFADVPPVVEPPEVPEEPVPLVDPSLIALPDRPRVHSVPFAVETFLWQAAKNQQRQWNLSLCAE